MVVNQTGLRMKASKPLGDTCRGPHCRYKQIANHDLGSAENNKIKLVLRERKVDTLIGISGHTRTQEREQHIWLMLPVCALTEACPHSAA